MTINQEQKFVTKVKTDLDERKPAKLMFCFIGMNVWKQKGTRTPYKSRFSPVRRCEPVSLFLTAIAMTFQPLATLTNVATNSSMHEKLTSCGLKSQRMSIVQTDIYIDQVITVFNVLFSFYIQILYTAQRAD